METITNARGAASQWCKKGIVAFIIMLSVAISQAATKTWQPVAGGAWTTAGNWSPSGAPAPGDDVIIGAQSAPITAIPTLSLKSMTINGSCTLQSAVARTLTLGGNAGTDFTIAAGANLTLGTTVNITLANNATAAINGTLTVNSANTFNTNNISVVTAVNSGGSIVNYGTVTCATASKLLLQSGSTYQLAADVGLPTATWNSNSTLLVTGIANTIVANPVNYASFSQSFGNVTWNCPGMSNALSMGGKLTTINGNFTMLSSGTGGFTFGNTGIGNINIGGNYIQSAGNVYCSGYNGAISGAARTINIGGNFSMSGGTFDLSTSSTAANTVTVNVAGNFSHTAGTITETGGTTASSITFTAGTHTYTSGGTVSNAVNFNVGAGATLNMASSTTAITGGGAFTLRSGGTLGVSSTAGITATGATGNIKVTGIRTYSAGNINYNGSAPQVTGAGLTAAANVTITNTAGVTFSTAAAITGTISMGAGTTANLGTGLNHTAGSLLLNGVNQTLGLSYGGTGSGANVINSTYFSCCSCKMG